MASAIEGRAGTVSGVVAISVATNEIGGIYGASI